ncbi:uncharacterized protein N7529_007555 [Penicillium soppii]|uniref:uncharacterized protein n=1 Tax=Penicillium soppii TaxID=69789 RepID=UPI002549BFCA|nr:uncharacterized protein N7529_007555 [Penicillium soppii]KAJ5860245.1 hypothetical protein N7529_007555 [Penicillium soppii]
MIFKLGSVLLSPAPMEVDLQLDQKEPVYTHRDTVSGRVILCNESAADLSTVVLKLSGTAISRFNHSSRTETHHIFKKSQQIFPPELLMKESKGSSVTLGGGILTLPFSITVSTIEVIKTNQYLNSN